MSNLLKRGAAALRASWARAAFAAGVIGALLLFAGDPIVVRELALNLVRAAAVLLTFEGFVRYSTRRTSESVGPIALGWSTASPASSPPGREADMPPRRRLRFADLFVKIWRDPSALPLAIFLVGNLAVRGGLVIAVWQ
ncbi:hypothetical protein EDC65_2231 [Stella humosa]|uniref:Uncharacterized protein n=1 Tax=Stella humosa TaxID=94 RepID=A0A3N1M3X3_9PROT|nr:hypothetical protein [Stella humosa]ROQ00432.1 hypothetical protein EDC65_2231 [Stella humosa]BBK30324.1 hypothetical protein STHU_09580 [Stella humosa]